MLAYTANAYRNNQAKKQTEKQKYAWSLRRAMPWTAAANLPPADGWLSQSSGGC